MCIDKIIISLHSKIKMVVIAQLVRASDCGSEGRGFESRFPPRFLLKESFILIRLVLGDHVLQTIRDFFMFMFNV